MSKKKTKKKQKLGTLKKEKVNISESLSAAIEYHKQGQIPFAIEIYRKILAVDKNNHVTLNLLGLGLNGLGIVEKSISCLSKAVSISPQNAKYHYDLGVVLQFSGQDEKAIRHYQLSLNLSPGNAAAWENLGVCFFDCCRNSDAVAAFERALNINPISILALTNLATLRRWQGQHEHSLELIDRAIDVDPTYIPARMKKAETLLSLGNFKGGWYEYGWRFLGSGRQGQDTVRYVPVPKWDGGLLKGKTILVHNEQGIGDEVMFASCLPDLLRQKVDCKVICDQRLVSAFRRVFPETEVLPDNRKGWGAVGDRLM